MPDMKYIRVFAVYGAMIVALFLAFRFVGVAGGVALLVVFIVYRVWKGRATAYYRAARRCFDDGDMDGVRNNIKKVVQAEPSNSVLLASCGFMLLKMGLPVEAERMMMTSENVASTSEEKYNAQTIRSLILWKKGKIEDAIEVLENVLKNYKTTAAYSTMGYFYIELGDKERALEFNKEAYEYNSGNQVIQDNYGTALFMAGNLEESKKIYESLIEANPAFPDAWYNYGRMLEAENMPDLALEMYRAASCKKFWYTSTITREEVDDKIKELENIYFIT